MVARVPVHLGRKSAWRNGRDHNVVLDQVQSHAPGQVDQPGLAGGVGIGLLRIDRHPVDRRDINHLGHMRLAGFAQQRVQGLGQEKRRLEVQVQHFVPAAFGELFERRTPGGAGVIDQDVELHLALRKCRSQRLCALHTGYVSGQGETRPHGRQLLCRLVAGRRLARREVHPRTLGQKTFGDHAADAARSTGNEGRTPLQRKNILHPIAPRKVPSLWRNIDVFSLMTRKRVRV